MNGLDRAWRRTPSGAAIALATCVLSADTVQGQLREATLDGLQGAISVRVDFEGRTEYRAGLIIGALPEPVSAATVLLPTSALYPDDLATVTSLEGWRGTGQILDLPAIDLDGAGGELASMSMVGLSAAPDVGVAACMSTVVSGDPVRVASAHPAGDLIAREGRITSAAPGRVTVGMTDLSRATLRPGDPVFVHAKVAASGREVPSFAPPWYVLGVLSSITGPNAAEVLTLPALFGSLPSEAGTWDLQPESLCDPDARSPELGASDRLLELLGEPLEALARSVAAIENGPLADGPDAAEVMRASWPPIRSYLDRPDIEHYFYNPTLTDEQQMGQFWQSALALAGDATQLISPLAAPSPIARLRASLDGGADERGWAIAVGSLDSPALMYVTAYHLVAPDPTTGAEREIMVYPPSLQGFPLEAVRMPWVDEELDIAAIAVPVNEVLVEQTFSIYQAPCTRVTSGPVEVPVTAWGWQRAHFSGAIAPASRPGQLAVSGIRTTGGYSGGPIFQNGNQIVGLLTGNLGSTGGALAASIQSALRLVPLGELRLVSPGCSLWPREREAKAVVIEAMAGRRPVPMPSRAVMTEIFGAEAAARLDLSAVEGFFSGNASASGRELREFAAVAGEQEWLATRDLVAAGLDVVPLTVIGQVLVPDTPEELSRRNQSRPTSRPPLRAEDTIGCDLPRPIGTPRPTMQPDVSLLLYGVNPSGGRGDLSAIVAYSRGRWWDPGFLRECEKLEARWSVPTGWVEGVASAAPTNVSVTRIPAGTFEMGGCVESPGTLSDGSPIWGLDCPDPAPTFQATHDAFGIYTFPVTVSEYADCVDRMRCTYQTPQTDFQRTPEECNWGRPGREAHPMNCVTWADALEYCQAYGGSLPSEAEWERAARGTDGRAFPWSMEDSLGFGRVREDMRGTMDVGLAPELASPAGVEDIGWHIEEWTADRYEPYAEGWTGQTLLEDDYERWHAIRGIRGSAFRRSATRDDRQDEFLGFRCVVPYGD